MGTSNPGDGVSDDEIERQSSNWRRAIVGEQKKTKSATDARCAILAETEEPSHLGKISSYDEGNHDHESRIAEGVENTPRW